MLITINHGLINVEQNNTSGWRFNINTYARVPWFATDTDKQCLKHISHNFSYTFQSRL